MTDPVEIFEEKKRGLPMWLLLLPLLLILVVFLYTMLRHHGEPAGVTPAGRPSSRLVLPGSAAIG